MKPVSLSIEGFRAFGFEQTMHFPTEAGVYLISGENGIGKTSFAEALCWVFYGKTSRGQKAGQVANWSENFDTIVDVNFDAGGDEHAVVRRWSPNSLTHQLGQAKPEIVSQTRLEEVVGMSYETFLATVLFSQSGSKFMLLSPSKQAAALCGVLSLDVWQERAKAAAEDASRADSDLEYRRTQLRIHKSEKQMYTTSYNEACDTAEEWDAARLAQREELETERSGAEANREVKKADHDSRKRSRDKAKQMSRDSGDRIHAAEQAAAVEESAVRKLRTELQAADNKVSATLAVIERIDALIKRGVCPTCERSVTEHKLEERERLGEVVKADRAALGPARKAVKAAEASWKLANETLSAVTTTSNDLVRRFHVRQGKFGGAEQELAFADRRVAAAKQALIRHDAAENPHDVTIDRLDGELQDVKGYIDETTADIEAHQREHGHAKYWATAFLKLRLWLLERALAEFEANMNNSLEQLGLAGWEVRCATQKELKSGDMRAEFTINIRSPGSPEQWIPFEQWSGGEAQRLTVAGAAAFCDLVSSRTHVDPTMEIWDEPTQHLSAKGCQDLMTFLQERSRATNKQVWVIDHQTQFAGEFTKQWTFRKEDDGTRIE